MPTQQGFVYLVLDVCSRKLVAWAVSSRQTVELVPAAWSQAVARRGARKIILHSDQGRQPTALASSQQCDAAGIQRSMGAVGNGDDNAMAESCLARPEGELLPRTQRADWA